MDGHLWINKPSQAVVKVLDLSGLSDLLREPKDSDIETKTAGFNTLIRDHITFKYTVESPDSRLNCTFVGNPQDIQRTDLTAEHLKVISFPGNTLGIGVGALGTSSEDTLSRIGEFLAIGGAAVYMPTTESLSPDYVIKTGDLVPQVSVLYCLDCEGSFSHFIRFETEKGRVVDLTGLCEAYLEITAADLIGIAFIAESDGLVGAALRRSPFENKTKDDIYRHPQVRQWFTFTSEPIMAQHMAFVIGVVGRRTEGPLRAYLRPLRRRTNLFAHLHACAFPFQPIKQGKVDLTHQVESIFQKGNILAMLHLLNDDRELTGVGESEFRRGICWAAPISEVVEKKK